MMDLCSDIYIYSTYHRYVYIITYYYGTYMVYIKLKKDTIMPAYNTIIFNTINTHYTTL
jgi:hypothetical protein